MPKRGYHHGNLRQALVDAALKLITVKGPTGFTLSEAAKQAGVTPAAVYRHFEGREDLIAEAALQGYEIFADVMQFAYDKGQPSALASFEATGRAYLAFARKYPGHYIAMFESGISVNRTSELAAASARARDVLEKAAGALSQHIPEDRRPPAATFSAAKVMPCDRDFSRSAALRFSRAVVQKSVVRSGPPKAGQDVWAAPKSTARTKVPSGS